LDKVYDRIHVHDAVHQAWGETDRLPCWQTPVEHYL